MWRLTPFFYGVSDSRRIAQDMTKGWVQYPFLSERSKLLNKTKVPSIIK